MSTRLLSIAVPLFQSYVSSVVDKEGLDKALSASAEGGLNTALVFATKERVSPIIKGLIGHDGFRARVYACGHWYVTHTNRIHKLATHPLRLWIPMPPQIRL